MGTKNNPGKYDCYQNAEADEPMFVLLARDPVAPFLVELWATLRREIGRSSPSKLDEAGRCAQAMRQWAAKNGRSAEDLLKVGEAFARLTREVNGGK